jgi:hypothetical protein
MVSVLNILVVVIALGILKETIQPIDEGDCLPCTANIVPVLGITKGSLRPYLSLQAPQNIPKTNAGQFVRSLWRIRYVVACLWTSSSISSCCSMWWHFVLYCGYKDEHTIWGIFGLRIASSIFLTEEVYY